MDTIKYEDFAKLDLRVGTVTAVRNHPNADKLLILTVNMGNGEERQIVAGIRKHYTADEVDGKINNLIEEKEAAIVETDFVKAAKLRDEIEALRKQKDGRAEIKGKQVIVIANLEPRNLRGEVSQGMLLAASDDEGNLALLSPDKIIKAGSRVG